MCPCVCFHVCAPLLPLLSDPSSLPLPPNHHPKHQAMQAAFGVPAVLNTPGEKAQNRMLDQEADDMLRFVSLWKSSGQ